MLRSENGVIAARNKRIKGGGRHPPNLNVLPGPRLETPSPCSSTAVPPLPHAMTRTLLSFLVLLPALSLGAPSPIPDGGSSTPDFADINAGYFDNNFWSYPRTSLPYDATYILASDVCSANGFDSDKMISGCWKSDMLSGCISFNEYKVNTVFKTPCPAGYTCKWVNGPGLSRGNCKPE